MTELKNHIEESIEEGQCFFKLQDLHEMLVNRLKQLGVEKEKNWTQLKEKLLLDYPVARDKSDGRHVVITFPQGMKKVMKDVLKEQDQSYKVNILAQAAKIVCTEALAEKHALFTGTFESKCQESYMPTALKTLVSMVVGGEEPQSHWTIAQIFLFNVKRSYAI